jgi:hypothetical protein
VYLGGVGVQHEFAVCEYQILQRQVAATLLVSADDPLETRVRQHAVTQPDHTRRRGRDLGVSARLLYVVCRRRSELLNAVQPVAWQKG